MKIQLDHWREISANSQFNVPTGRVRVRCTQDCNLFLSELGHEVLAGFGREIDVQTVSPAIGVVEAPKGARVFLYDPGRIFIEPTGEKFTNIDRQPMESGSVLAVRQAMRDMQLQQRGLMLEMREERRALEASRSRRPRAEPVQETERNEEQTDVGETDATDQ